MSRPFRPFRFAVQSFSAACGREWRERAKRAEGLGYSALHLADHVIGPGRAIAKSNHPIQELAAVPAMMAAADATTTLKVGCRVFCVDYQHPAVLAKQAATIDLLSDGRLELGLGAGWLASEYEALGLRMDPPGARIARLAETVGAFRALFSGEEVAIAGKDVRLAGFAGAPARRFPPLMIGGGGRRVLSLAAREADIVSLNFDNRSGVLGPAGVRSGNADATAEKIAWVKGAAGARFAELELEIGAYFTYVQPGAEKIAAGLGRAMGIEPAEMLRHPHGLFGSVDSVCDELSRRRELYGIHYVTVGDTALEPFAPVVTRLAGR
jgi:probable F420-dependent oxidoreductase